MGKEISSFRSAMVQKERNEQFYPILVWEIIITSFGLAIYTGIQTSSFMWFVGSFFIYIFLVTATLHVPILCLAAFAFVSMCWATPFLLIGMFIPAFYFIAVAVFLFSFWAHGKALTHLFDLDRED